MARKSKQSLGCTEAQDSLRLGIRKNEDQTFRVQGSAHGSYGVLALVVVAFMFLALAMVYLVLAYGKT